MLKAFRYTILSIVGIAVAVLVAIFAFNQYDEFRLRNERIANEELEEMFEKAMDETLKEEVAPAPSE